MKPNKTAWMVIVFAALCSAACLHDYDEFEVGEPGAVGGAGTGGGGGVATGGALTAGAPAAGGAAGGPGSGGAPTTGGAPAAGGAGTGGAVGGTGGGGACTAPEVNCSGVCAVVDRDAQHCGSCGNACPTTMSCSASLCGCTDVGDCGTGPGRACDGNRLCVCQETTCKPGEICTDRQCTCNGGARCMGADEICCAGAPSNCKNRLTDPQNCGACGKVCPPNNNCASGQCVPI